MDPQAYLEILPPAEALARARALAGKHYENFAVGSRFVPGELRDDFARLYAFCRATDDLGDEAAGDRLALLAGWRASLDGARAGAPAPWPLAAAAALIGERKLPDIYFLDLIEANRRDQSTTRYADWPALRDYTVRSADCVGRLVLRLFKIADPECDRLSDLICTGLQYANFWQDLGVDAKQGRIYLPRSEWAGLSEADFFAAVANDALKSVLKNSLLPKTRALFDEGQGLRARVPAPLARQLALYIGGGRAILEAIEREGCDPLKRRPTLSKIAKAGLLLRAWWG